eukprot:Gb_17541 [translate_table: standard]
MFLTTGYNVWENGLAFKQKGLAVSGEAIRQIKSQHQGKHTRAFIAALLAVKFTRASAVYMACIVGPMHTPPVQCLICIAWPMHNTCLLWDSKLLVKRKDNVSSLGQAMDCCIMIDKICLASSIWILEERLKRNRSFGIHLLWSDRDHCSMENHASSKESRNYDNLAYAYSILDSTSTWSGWGLLQLKKEDLQIKDVTSMLENVQC